jgi:hypothetical protein|tara:strand:+ start:382 stop:540 length:159 start_codon:yes stop_codon:yes gene_type:complete
MSRNRKYIRRKYKNQQKVNITRKDKILGILALIMIFLAAAIATIYFSIFSAK